MPLLRILIIGDVVGAPGRAMVQKHLPQLRLQYHLDGIIVNGENSANGRGITPKIMRFFKQNGVDLVTSGNHIWQRKEIYSYLAEHKDLLRPVNFPAACPGTGAAIVSIQGHPVGVINVQGRVFMRELVACPFRALETALAYLQAKTRAIIIDVHAETTAEKLALAYFVDGRASCVVGTHTHVQTADERILPAGTAYITDLGMVGALNSMIGMKKEALIQHMLTQMPTRFEVDTTPPFVLSGVVVTIDTTSGTATAIERVYHVDHELHLDPDDQQLD